MSITSMERLDLPHSRLALYEPGCGKECVPIYKAQNINNHVELILYSFFFQTLYEFFVSPKAQLQAKFKFECLNTRKRTMVTLTACSKVTELSNANIRAK